MQKEIHTHMLVSIYCCKWLHFLHIDLHSNTLLLSKYIYSFLLLYLCAHTNLPYSFDICVLYAGYLHWSFPWHLHYLSIRRGRKSQTNTCSRDSARTKCKCVFWFIIHLFIPCLNNVPKEMKALMSCCTEGDISSGTCYEHFIVLSSIFWSDL